MGSKHGGLSLAEVITVTAIIGILAAVAIPRFAGAMANHRLEMAATRIVADLSLVQRQARTTSTSQKIEFDLLEGLYYLPTAKDIDHPGSVYVIKLSEEPYQATLLSADFGGDPEIIFDGYGIPDSDGSVVIQVAGQQRMITVDAETGRATVSEVKVDGRQSKM